MITCLNCSHAVKKNGTYYCKKYEKFIKVVIEIRKPRWCKKGMEQKGEIA